VLQFTIACRIYTTDESFQNKLTQQHQKSIMKMHLAVIIGLFFPMLLHAQSTPQIGRWDRFETTIAISRQHADPYRDITLDVTYTSPSGRTTNFWGFYDGGSSWKIRFMPDEIGVWRYEAQFSDGKPGANGVFNCVASTLPGMISVDVDNPQWFGWKNGGHVLVRSFHAGDRMFAENFPAGRRKPFLDWLQGNRYNMLSVASHYLNRDADGRGKGWKTPKLWPLNYAEYQKMEAILDDLATRRIMVYPFAGFFGQSGNFPIDHTDQELYIRYTLARLGSYWNLLFNVAGPEPNMQKAPPLFHNAMTPKDVNRLGALIKKLDPFGHLISIHNRTGDDPYRSLEWPGYGTLQGPKTTNLDKLSKGLLESHHSSRPLYAQETLWGGNVYHPHYSPTALRKNAWVINMSAAALNFADMNGNSSSGFSGHMDRPFRHQEFHDIVGAVWNFLETIPWYRMSPRQDLVDDGFCLAEPGSLYLTYLPNGGRFDVKTEGGPYRITWINAQDTDDRRPGGTTKDGKRLYAPSDADDWLCWLTDMELSKDMLPDAPQVIAKGVYPDIAADNNGNLHLVYARDDKLCYRRYDAQNDVWSDEDAPGIDIADVTRSDPDVVVDSHGRPHVFAGNAYACWNGLNWQRVDPPNVVRDTELAIDSKDNVYLVHRGGNNDGNLGLQVLRPETNNWEALPDPDKPKPNYSNHVYGDITVGPGDVLHLIQRHGWPTRTAYRQSIDGGQTWLSESITNHEPEAPHITVNNRGVVFATDGSGVGFRRTTQGWVSEGSLLKAPTRGQPELATDKSNNVYCGALGGRYNVRYRGAWIGERVIQPVTSRRLVGFTEFAGARNGAWIVWEESNAGNGDTGMTEDPVIVVAAITADGKIVGMKDIQP
jgi:hypothetical protein